MKDELFQELLDSVREAGAIMRGEADPSRVFSFDDPDPKAIRERLGLTQEHFAALLGISRRTLEGWEQGRRKPDGPARRLLEIAARKPELFLETLYGGHVARQG